MALRKGQWMVRHPEDADFEIMDRDSFPRCEKINLVCIPTDIVVMSEHRRVAIVRYRCWRSGSRSLSRRRLPPEAKRSG